MLATLQLVAINKHHDTDMLWLVETDDFGIYLCGGQVGIIFIFIWIMHTVKTWRFCTNKKKKPRFTRTPHHTDLIYELDLWLFPGGISHMLPADGFLKQIWFLL
jgi:hypothetical protein